MVSKLKIILQNKVAKNSIWIIVERIIQMLISLVIGSLTVRYLGPSNYGLINYGQSIVLLFSAITKLGLENIIIKEYIDNKETSGEIVGSAMALRILSSFVSVILIIATIMVLKPNNNLILWITIIQSLCLFFQVYEILEFYFQSKLESKKVSITKVIAYIFATIYKVYLLVSHKSIIWFCFSTLIDYAIIMIILFVWFKKEKKLKVRKLIMKDLLTKGSPFIISSMMITIYMQTDKIMIGSMLDEYQLGLYSAATAICILWGFIPEAIINSMRPVIFEKKKTSEEEYLKKIKLLFMIVFWLGIFFCLGISIFSKLVIYILYGKEYFDAQMCLIIAVWYTTFAYLGTARTVWLVAENKAKYAKWFTIWGAIINVLLNSILIPKFGINGAAIATLVSQIFTVMITPIFYKETKVFSKIVIKSIFNK